MKPIKLFLYAITLLVTSAAWAWADDSAPTIMSNKEAIDLVQTHANYLWTLVAAALVFFMQAGFAMVETGFTRSKNAINILMKNLMDFSAGSIAFWAIGFGLMFGVSKTGWFGTTGFFLSDFTPDGDPWVLAFWMFQVVFAAPPPHCFRRHGRAHQVCQLHRLQRCRQCRDLSIFGGWAWGSLFNGSGWLEGLGFIDFAGSTVVHSVGGWAALAGAIVLGPRLGKYGKDGKPRAIMGHNMPLAALGVFILWLGWFGFNPGSTTTADKSIAMIFVNTNLAAAAGAITAMITSWIKFGKPEVGMSLNGALAGLVAITAGCANVLPGSAIIIGAIAGILVVLSVLFFEKLKIDDPVGAVSVHGVNGAWGTLAAGLFNIGGTTTKIIMVQLTGIGACFIWTFLVAFIMFKVIAMTIGLRVSPEEEIEGLDITEHGGEAYPDFGLSTHGMSAASAPPSAAMRVPSGVIVGQE